MRPNKDPNSCGERARLRKYLRRCNPDSIDAFRISLALFLMLDFLTFSECVFIYIMYNNSSSWKHHLFWSKCTCSASSCHLLTSNKSQQNKFVARILANIGISVQMSKCLCCPVKVNFWNGN